MCDTIEFVKKGKLHFVIILKNLNADRDTESYRHFHEKLGFYLFTHDFKTEIVIFLRNHVNVLRFRTNTNFGSVQFECLWHTVEKQTIIT